MHRLATAAAGVVLLLAAAACSSDSGDGPPADVVDACSAYNDLVNQWAIDYGKEIGAVEEAAAAGDQARKETSVAVVRELFVTTANGLRDQAGATSDQDLADALTTSADGLAGIADQIETYEDVTDAPELMSTGQFAEGGEQVSSICAG